MPAMQAAAYDGALVLAIGQAKEILLPRASTHLVRGVAADVPPSPETGGESTSLPSVYRIGSDHVALALAMADRMGIYRTGGL